MTIAERFHTIILKIEEIWHLHPFYTTLIAAKKADIAVLVQHPDVTPEQAASVQSLANGAAVAVPRPAGPQPVYDGQPRIPDFVNPPPAQPTPASAPAAKTTATP